ncbi:PREDICTED: uncharacterized protein C11orf24 homolog [Chrysochloris asiatica]|uniref:Uncharacterized protein C11orf24 homolog n=1 Tax=Chrysochloris asiatica TaxID=185453 RepID=A0A9B0T9U0_CHRAS|nr:PREDICTED: uncharacterized protein C11orf24 homolog [Chrysochloris asiatica]
MASQSVKNSPPVGTAARVGNKTSGRITTVMPPPVTRTKGAPVVTTNSTAVSTDTAERAAVGVATTVVPVTNVPTPSASMGPALSFPTSATRTLPTLDTRHPPPSTPQAHVPGSSSTSPETTVVTTQALSGKTVAMSNASGPVSTHSPSKPMTGNSTADLRPPTSPQAPNTTAQGPTPQASTGQPTATTAGPSTPTLLATTLKPTTVPSVSSVPTTTAATTKAHVKEPTANTAPAPHTSPAPTTQMQPNLTPLTQGPTELASTQTLGLMGTEARPGTAPTGPTLGASKLPATDACQLSTQGLVVTAEPMAPSLSFLLTVLLLGVTLFITVLVLFALQAYESYKKKDYTQVDYLINGMYADSEM